MNRAYFSSVLQHPAGRVWDLIRDFNSYPRYISGVTESVIEDERRGDEVGAVRRFCYAGRWVRQRLVSHSDAERAFSYAGLQPLPFPAAGERTEPIQYTGTLRVTPVIDGDRAFVEWFIDFDCATGDVEAWKAVLASMIPLWVGSLGRTLDQKYVPALLR